MKGLRIRKRKDMCDLVRKFSRTRDGKFSQYDTVDAWAELIPGGSEQPKYQYMMIECSHVCMPVTKEISKVYGTHEFYILLQ